MIPPLIIEAALDRGINLIAVTDHNATGNVRSVIAAAEGTGITVLPGMELQTQEEVHLLCLFDSISQAETWQSVVDSRLPTMRNRPEFFGDQLIVDSAGNFLSREERLLATSVQMSLEQAVTAVTQLGGLAVPAHVDRRTNGLIPVLGFIPTNVGFEALEISRQLPPEKVCSQFPQLAAYPLLIGGDAHSLDDIVGANSFQLESPTIAAIRLALAGSAGRFLAQYSMDNLPEYE